MSAGAAGCQAGAEEPVTPRAKYRQPCFLPHFFSFWLSLPPLPPEIYRGECRESAVTSRGSSVDGRAPWQDAIAASLHGGCLMLRRLRNAGTGVVPHTGTGLQTRSFGCPAALNTMASGPSFFGAPRSAPASRGSCLLHAARSGTSVPPRPAPPAHPSPRPRIPAPAGPEGGIRPFLDNSITRHYLSDAGIPDQGGKIIAEYVWIGGTGQVRTPPRSWQAPQGSASLHQVAPPTARVHGTPRARQLPSRRRQPPRHTPRLTHPALPTPGPGPTNKTLQRVAAIATPPPPPPPPHPTPAPPAPLPCPQDLRSKARTLTKKPTSPKDLPNWNYDGSSTGQAPGEDSEVYLVPQSIFR